MRPRLGVLLFLALLGSVGVSAQNDPLKKAQASLGPAPMAGPGGTWSTVAQTTTDRWEAGVVALNGKIYVLGGGAALAGQPNLPLAQEFDPATGRWRDLAPLPQGASHLDAITLNGKIYIAGGFGWSNHRNPLDLFLEYDPATDHWKQLGRLSSPRGSVSLVTVGGMIHAIGGTGGDFRPVGTHEVFNPATGAWTPAAPLLTPRDHLGNVISVDGKLHVFGGRWTGFAGTSVTLHDVYDPTTDKWTSAAPLPAPRSEGGVAYYHGLILYFGGDCNDPKAAGAFDDLQAYDPTTDSWKPLTKAPIGLHGQGAAIVGDAAYFIGGGTSCAVAPMVSKSVLAFRLP
jgi:N-acetylneuraminic acid mutarotase